MRAGRRIDRRECCHANNKVAVHEKVIRVGSLVSILDGVMIRLLYGMERTSMNSKFSHGHSALLSTGNLFCSTTSMVLLGG